MRCIQGVREAIGQRVEDHLYLAGIAKAAGWTMHGVDLHVLYL